jgi:hypothetical protein
VFIAIRRLIGIPTEQPFDTIVDRFGDTMVASEPWRTPMLNLWHRDGLPITTDDESDAPVTYVRVNLDSNFSSTGPNGESCTELHHRLTAELGAWCDQQGLEWWTRNDGISDDCSWTMGTPAYAKETSR